MGKKKGKKKGNEHLLKHKYNPDFELMEKKEVEKLLEEKEIGLFDLPKINLEDPVSKLFDAEINDVFKITRKSHTAGETVFYRVVVHEEQ